MDTALEPVIFVVDNKRTEEDCGCEYYDRIKGNIWIGENETCFPIREQNKPFKMGEEVYVGIKFDDDHLEGTLKITKVYAQCPEGKVSYSVST